MLRADSGSSLGIGWERTRPQSKTTPDFNPKFESLLGCPAKQSAIINMLESSIPKPVIAGFQTLDHQRR